MRRLIYLFVLVIAVSGYAKNVQANCECVCMNGQNQPVCDSSIEIRPICPPQICPIEPPSIPPIQQPTIPPVGTQSCQQEQVYNENSGQYEWRTICR